MDHLQRKFQDNTAGVIWWKAVIFKTLKLDLLVEFPIPLISHDSKDLSEHIALKIKRRICNYFNSM